MKYKNAQNELFVDPIVSNHADLVFISDEEFNEQLAINNAPAPMTPLEIRNNALANITWTRNDGVEVQIRHPDYASDYLLMERARDQLADGESRMWISKDNQSIMLSKEDMVECLGYGDSEIKRIYEDYILTL
jgi:hypothetical protein